MNNTIRNIVCCVTAVILLVTTSGCDWMFPLTSPSQAKVDKRLLGYWKFPNKEGSDEFEIYAVSECAKEPSLKGLPGFPHGAMFAKGLRLNDADVMAGFVMVIWPTQIGSTTYLNITGYDMERKKLDTSSTAYIIMKYKVTGDSLALYLLTDDAKKRIKSRLGSSYNSADLLQDISKATEWEMHMRGTRIRL
jgi:hypothetical protein